MTLRQIGVRFLLLALLLAPAIYLGWKAYDSGLELKFAQTKLETIRTASGQGQRDIDLARAQAKNLASAGVRAWGAGQAEDRIGAAFLETDLVQDPNPQTQSIISAPTQGQLVGFKRITVRAMGTPRAAKEALWNLGDLGPGIRIESFKGEVEPVSGRVIWTYVIQAIETAPSPLPAGSAPTSPRGALSDGAGPTTIQTRQVAP
jgi:hypothetical protein